MSEFFSGITFPQQKITPSDDAAIRRAVLADGILSGCKISHVGSTLTMGAGLLIGCGRQFRHTAVQNWAVTGATSGYARLLFTIDATRSSSKDSFDQIVDSIEYASALDGFVSLQQDDINNAGTVYQIPVCIVSLGPGGITGIVAQLGGNSAQIVLHADAWTNKQQTVQVPGVSGDYDIMVAVDQTDDDNAAAYYDAEVVPISKNAGTVTFKCASAPIRDLTVNIALRV